MPAPPDLASGLQKPRIGTYKNFKHPAPIHQLNFNSSTTRISSSAAMSLNQSSVPHELASFICDDNVSLSSMIEAFQDGMPTEEATTMAKTIFTINHLIMELVGVPLLVSLIYYEKFGCDPEKRSLYDQLLSKIWLACIIGPSTISSMIMARLLFGVLPLAFGYLAMLFQMVTTTFGFLCMTEILMYKILQKVRYQYVASRDDNFFCVFLTAFNVIASVLTSLVALMLDEPGRMVVFLSTEADVSKKARYVLIVLRVYPTSIILHPFIL